MVNPINLLTHPHFTIDEIIQWTGWPIPSPLYKENMRKALMYFQQVVPRHVLRTMNDAGPWNFHINGVKIRLLNYLQGIDFHKEVNPHRYFNKGSPLIGYTEKDGSPGNWYTFPSTRQDAVAVHSSQRRLHKFKARTDFVCMQSTIADAYVGWLTHLLPEYRHGGGTQLFIWNAQQFLERL